jgi:hypothetical protein
MVKLLSLDYQMPNKAVEPPFFIEGKEPDYSDWLREKLDATPGITPTLN